MEINIKKLDARTVNSILRMNASFYKKKRKDDQRRLADILKLYKVLTGNDKYIWYENTVSPKTKAVIDQYLNKIKDIKHDEFMLKLIKLLLNKHLLIEKTASGKLDYYYALLKSFLTADYEHNTILLVNRLYGKRARGYDILINMLEKEKKRRK